MSISIETFTQLTTCRITKSTLEDMEQKYHDSLEQIALLEAEISGQDDLKIELQRVKDELRDTSEELAVATNKLEAFNQNHGHGSPGRIGPELMRKSSRLNFYHAGGIPEDSTIPSGKLENPYLTTNMHSKSQAPRLTSSRSLRKIHGMLDQMKSLETRVANFKSSLPKPITPTKIPAHIPTSPSPRPSSKASIHSHRETSTPVNDGYSSPTLTATQNSSNIPRLRVSNEILSRSNEDTYSARNKRRSLTSEMYYTNHPTSPVTEDEVTLGRSRSAAGNYSPSKPKHGGRGSIDGNLDLSNETSDPHRRHDSKRFGGSYQGSARTQSILPPPTSRNSTDIPSFSGLSLNEMPSKTLAPHPSAALLYSHSNRSSNNMDPPSINTTRKPRSKPSLTGFDSYSNPFYYPSHNSSANASTLSLPSQTSGANPANSSRPGSTFGMLHSRQTLGHGRLA